MSQLDNILEKLRRVQQDPDVDDKKGTQPKKYYSGVRKDKKDARDAHFKKGASMSDDNPNAYKEAPGDRDKDGKLKKTKPSKHTNKFKQMYGEATDKAQEKAKKEIDKLKKQMTKHSRVINSPTISITRISIAIDQLNKIKKQIEDIQKKAGLTGAFYEAVSPAQLKEVFLPYSQPWNDKKGLHQTLGLLRDTKSRKNAAKAIEKLAKKHKVEFEVDGRGQKQFVYLTSFDGKAIDKLKKDLMKNKNLIKALDTVNGTFKEAVSPAQQAAIAIAKKKSGKYDKDGKRLEKEACWDGYKKVGMKKKGDKMVPNCVPEMNEKNKDITAISTWKKNLKKVKGLSKDTMQQLSMLPTPVITSLINQIGMIVAQYNEELEESRASIERRYSNYDMRKYMNLKKQLADLRVKADKAESGGRKDSLMGIQRRMDQIKDKMHKIKYEELGPNADAGDYIDDFRKSDAPQFKGKSDKKIRKMAIAAYLDSKEKK